MCRIAGIIQLGNSKITPWELKQFLLNMEYGGRDATGMAFVCDNEIIYNKAKGKASAVIKDDFKDKVSPLINKAKAILLHTRSATHGTPKDNKNNHPIVGDKYIMVHNGVVDTTETFADAKGETDTEQMLKSIEKYGFDEGFAKVTGWVATIFADINSLNDYYWYTNPSGSLVSAMDNRNIWFLASTFDIIKRSLLNSHDLIEYTVKDNVLYKCDLNTGLINIAARPVVKAYTYTASNYYGTYLDKCMTRYKTSLKASDYAASMCGYV